MKPPPQSIKGGFLQLPLYIFSINYFFDCTNGPIVAPTGQKWGVCSNSVVHIKTPRKTWRSLYLRYERFIMSKNRRWFWSSPVC